MGTLAPELPASSGEGFASDLAGMGNFLIDPAGAARRVHSKWFWIGPLIVISIISVVVSVLMMPITQHVLEIAPLQPGMTPAQHDRIVSIGMTVMRITTYLSPIVVAIFFAIGSLILFGSSAVFGVKARFWQLFNLIAGCGLIDAIMRIAQLVVLKAKGEITTQAELRPALGLDIFLPAGSNKFLTAFLGYFSVFEIWWIVMLVLIFAAAFKVGKGKAFAVAIPLILVRLCFAMLSGFSR